jgi:hypothetical protein
MVGLVDVWAYDGFIDGWKDEWLDERINKNIVSEKE